MGEQPADEVVAGRRQPVAVRGVVERRLPRLAVRAARAGLAQRQMQVGTVARLVGDRLGCQACPHPAAERDAAHRLAIQHLVVGGAQRRGVPHRHLLLPVAQFGVVVLDLHALFLQGLVQLERVVVRKVEAGGRVAQAVVRGHQPVGAAVRTGLAAAEGEYRLERGDRDEPLGGQVGDCPPEVGARTAAPRLTVRLDQVGQHRGRARRVWQRHEGGRVRHDADLPDRAHALHRLQVIEHRHGHHGDGVPDPGDHPGWQRSDRRRLAPDDPAVVGIEKPDQRDLLCLGAGGGGRGCLLAGGGDRRPRLWVLVHV